MIKKLRLKFILMSMGLIALIMLILFVAVYSMMKSVIISRSEGVLDLAEESIRVGIYFKQPSASGGYTNFGDETLNDDHNEGGGSFE